MDEVIDVNATEIPGEDQPEPDLTAWVGTSEEYQRIIDILHSKISAVDRAVIELSAELSAFIGQFQGVIPGTPEE